MFDQTTFQPAELDFLSRIVVAATTGASLPREREAAALAAMNLYSRGERDEAKMVALLRRPQLGAA